MEGSHFDLHVPQKYQFYSENHAFSKKILRAKTHYLFFYKIKILSSIVNFGIEDEFGIVIITCVVSII